MFRLSGGKYLLVNVFTAIKVNVISKVTFLVRKTTAAYVLLSDPAAPLP